MSDQRDGDSPEIGRSSARTSRGRKWPRFGKIARDTAIREGERARAQQKAMAAFLDTAVAEAREILNAIPKNPRLAEDITKELIIALLQAENRSQATTIAVGDILQEMYKLTVEGDESDDPDEAPDAPQTPPASDDAPPPAPPARTAAPFAFATQ